MKKIAQSVFNFLALLNVAIFVISAITFLTFLQLAAIQLQNVYKDWQWLKTLASIDFFQSKVFIIFALLFVVNLLACCIKQFLNKTIKVLKFDPKLIDHNAIDSLPAVERLSLNYFDESSIKLSESLSVHFKKPVLIDARLKQRCFYAEKFRYSHLAFYLAHLSILTLVIGILLSAQGYQYSIDVSKNQTIDPLMVVDNKNNKIALDFGLSCDDFNIKQHKGAKKEKEYHTTLSILKNGKKVKTRVVDYGTPLQYDGFDIYQDRFGKKIRYSRIRVISRVGKNYTFKVKKNERFKLPDSRITIRPVRLKSDTVQLESSSPRAKLWISENPARFSEKELKGYRFSFMGYSYKETTSLKIIRDPGKIIVWCSVLSMLVGFSIMFFLSNSKIWALVKKEERGCSITLGGTSTKNLNALKETLSTIRNELKEG